MSERPKSTQKNKIYSKTQILFFFGYANFYPYHYPRHDPVAMDNPGSTVESPKKVRHETLPCSTAHRSSYPLYYLFWKY
jgi:hypothetical protein